MIATQSGGRVEPPGGTSIDPVLEVRNLWIQAGHRDRGHTIVAGIDLDLAAGETLGIVGESGSGKSMTAKAIAGLLPDGVSATGSVRYGGRDVLSLAERERARLRGRDIGMVFQDPFTMLNPLLRVGEQVLECARQDSGRRFRGADARAEAIRRLAEVGIRDESVLDRYPFQLSGGMRQRVGIAAALAADPKLLIADEPSTALDVTTQKEILDLLLSLQRSRGMALILITHDLRVAFSVCHRISVLYAGRMLEQATGHQIEGSARHPYTLGLLLSEPDPRRRRRLEGIAGAVPKPDAVAGECAFAARCRWVQPQCRDGAPPLRKVEPTRYSACVRLAEIAGQLDAARAQRTAATHAAGPRATEPLLEVVGLSKRFRGRKGREVVAVNDASLVVHAGEAVGVVGESGSGKTTLARCVVGLERPTAGRIELGGTVATGGGRMDRATRAAIVAHAQMVFQDPYSSLNPRRRIGSTLLEVLRRADPPPQDGKRAVAELLDRVGLPAAYAERRPAKLSGGERQRVAVARALALRPRLLVCDEPVSALDVSVQAQILNLLNDLRDELGLSYLFITHDLAVVRQIADRVYVMRQGEVVESGSIDAVLDRPQHSYTRQLVAAVPTGASGHSDGDAVT